MKTYKDIIKNISESNSIAELDTTNAIEFIFRDLKVKLESMEDIEIYILGLGSFVPKRKKIYDLIFYYEAKKRNIQEKQLKEVTKKIISEDCDRKIESLKRLNELYKQRDQKRKEFKDGKKQIIGDIQEPETNMGRAEE